VHLCLPNFEKGSATHASVSDAVNAFSQNASFHPNMLNYLNTTFTFGKQIKVNFINRKVDCRPARSLIFSFSCPLFLSGGSRVQQP